MPNVPTPHNAAREGEIAKTVLMPGDPLRAKFIVETHLENAACFDTVRNMPGFAGTYKGHPVFMMDGDMGMPSVGTYTYELFNFCGIENIIHIGSAGGLTGTVQLRSMVVGVDAYANSSFARQYRLPNTYAPIADYGLLSRAVETAEELGVPMKVGDILSSDAFYDDNEDVLPAWRKVGVLAVEMEAAAFYMNTTRAGRNTLCLLTISDRPLAGKSLPAEERQAGFTQMMEIALALA